MLQLDGVLMAKQKSYEQSPISLCLQFMYGLTQIQQYKVNILASIFNSINCKDCKRPFCCSVQHHMQPVKISLSIESKLFYHQAMQKPGRHLHCYLGWRPFFYIWQENHHRTAWRLMTKVQLMGAFSTNYKVEIKQMAMFSSA